jgi:predicted amidohydrolase YtcJ
MKRTIAVFAGLLAAGVLFAYIIHLTPHGATMLFVNARVYTLDPGNTVCQAVAVRDDRIIDLGSTQELRSRYPDAPVTDLHGKTVLPGLIDAHAHIRGLGQLLHSVILVGAPSGEEAAGFVGERAKGVPPGQWIYGRGWDQNLWKSKQFPTARMLDAGAPANPVILIRIDGHAIWVNTRAMELAGVTRKTPDPAGGKIIRLPDGSPSGVFVDDARDLIERYTSKLTREELQLRLSDALRECARQGLTEVGDMGVDSLQIEL